MTDDATALAKVLSDDQIRAITMSPNPYYEINHILLCWPPAANIRPSEVLRTLDELEKLRARVAELDGVLRDLIHPPISPNVHGVLVCSAELYERAEAALTEPASEPRTED